MKDLLTMFAKSTSLLLGWVLIGFLGLGCSGPTLTDPSEIGAIGSAGGVVRSDTSAAILEVPAQSLDNSLILQITEAAVSNPPANHTTLSDAITVEPEAVPFGKQQFAFLSIPLKRDAVPSNASILNLKIFRKTESGWEAYDRFSLQEGFDFVVVWLEQTGTYAAFLPNP